MTATQVDHHPTSFAPYAPLPQPVRPMPPGLKPSGWFRRVNATLVDAVLVPVAALVLAVPVLALAAAGSVPPVAALIAFYVGYFAAVLANQVLQGRTGATVGKHLLGLRVVDERTFEHIGVGSSIGRYFVHLIDTLPLYLGWFAPIVDRRRRTFTDMAMGTLVVRAPRARPGVGAGLVATAISGVLVVGSFALMDMSDPLAGALGTSTQPGTVAGSVPRQPSPLFNEDLEGRIMPPLPGFGPVTDPRQDFGPRTVDELAAASSTSPEETAGIADTLRRLGVQDAYDGAFAGPQYGYTVLVYRLGSAEQATRFVDEVRAGGEVIDLGLPYAVGFTEEGGNVHRALFAYGPHAWEVAVFGEGGAAGPDELASVVRQQRAHATAVAWPE